MKKITTTTKYQKEMLMLALTMVIEQGACPEVKMEAKQQQRVLSEKGYINVSETKQNIGLDICVEGAIRSMASRVKTYDDKPEDVRQKAVAELQSILAQFRKTK